ncbi:hypothetical protein PRIPAC_95687 [Pristionchus pacificus]|uniref:ShK domain-containing protein n=1 Tax=Pristionchus pacificus TaxID=54126 RepID=A0A2A6D2D4_PRIPA|nr:hypothetical protein PRIPAC_95687 [Pristionchus pacificus]|eukprot:PDM84594.1 ShK domain-containing protein [Pristionchus pacificus]
MRRWLIVTSIVAVACMAAIPTRDAADSVAVVTRRMKRQCGCFGQQQQQSTSSAAPPSHSFVLNLHVPGCSSCQSLCLQSCYTADCVAGYCFDVTADCAKKTHLCTTPSYLTMMQQYCKKTCNFCKPKTTTTLPPTTTASSCVDVTNDCEVKTHLCDRPEYQTMVNTYCQKTCNRCSVQKTTPSPPGKLQKTQVSVSSFCTLTRSGGARACEYTRKCTDVTPDCAAKEHLCSIPSYNDMMTKYCRRTCNLCAAKMGGTSSDGGCADVTPDCKNKLSLCSAAAYKSTMQTYCKKTCKYC